MLTEELFQTLAASGGARVERIVSLGQCSPEGEWFDQDQDEWVLLLAGEALLLLEGEPAPRRLASGDHLLIPAHCRHRVAWTDPDRHTIWLAVHFAPR
ncbi:cupin [Geobacter sp. SVR]|uniref:cupin domain-containing protein n=1 Tax=Geobacter sp. SVR TaxID=2495594 RepID=UPI00143EFE8A|nr:cupin domain-containing protein [Geobacter sp. SVR]BCS53359.1 cupin [Geobacter sp. SVR]GCF85515.1 cupin [Geobacter sp. SVR]